MRIVLTAIVLGLLQSTTVLAQDVGPAGNWKLIVIDEGPLWLIRLEDQKGKLGGDAVALRKVPPTVLEDVRVEGNLLQFSLKLQNKQSKLRLRFEGKLTAPGAKKIFGSLTRGDGGVIPVHLEATTAKNNFELDREFVLLTPNDPQVFGVVLDLLHESKAQKATAKEVEEWVGVGLRSAERHGPRWQAEARIRLLDELSNDFGDLAGSIGKKIEAGLDPKTPFNVQLRLFDTLRNIAKKTDKAEEGKLLDAKIEALEPKGYAEYLDASKDIPIEKFAGRKSKSTRGVLVELFTGAQCPPCVAADIAFDALEKTYPSSDIILLQYHLHVPGPDPLANSETGAREEYYKEAVGGTPTILFNGKAEVEGGGGHDEAKVLFDQYRTALDKLLEKDSTVKLTATAGRKTNKVNISATVKGLEKPGDKIRLRLALVEDWVRYKGGNGMAYHHRVVRTMPGGAKGTALLKPDNEVTQVVDLDELQKTLNTYLDDFAKKEMPFPNSQRPLRLRQLHVVAFVQDDANAEVLQAIDVPVRPE